MADSVKHLLSAVTEGHISNSTSNNSGNSGVSNAYASSASASSSGTKLTLGGNRTQHEINSNRSRKSSRASTLATAPTTSNEAKGKQFKATLASISPAINDDHPFSAINHDSGSSQSRSSKHRKQAVLVHSESVTSSHKSLRKHRTLPSSVIETSTKTASSPTPPGKAHKLKRKSHQPQNQDRIISISDSDDESDSAITKRSCIASRTRSKVHIDSPSPNKRIKVETDPQQGGRSRSSAGNNDRASHSGRRKPSNRKTDHSHFAADSPASSVSSVSSSSTSASSSAFISGLLRRSSRSKGHQSTVTTGSCVSSAASTSQTCTSYQVRGPTNNNTSIGSAASLHASASNSSATTQSSGNNNHKSLSAKYGQGNRSTPPLSASQTFTLDPLTSQTVMANDGSRDAHQPNQNHYGMPNAHIVSPPQNLRRSPRGSIRGGSGASGAGSASAASSAGPSTNQLASAWDAGHQQNAVNVAATVAVTSSKSRTSSFFSSTTLESAFSMSQQQSLPSTSQSMPQTEAASSKLGKPILVGTAMPSVAASSSGPGTESMANVGLAHGLNFGASSTSGANSSGSSAQPTAADTDVDDPDVGRLQALLEARGIPPHVFGSLAPRMHHLLHRTIGANSTSKAQQLLQGLQSSDESQQLQAAIEMCQMLVMGNEDTLAGFPVKMVVPALITLLRMEHNFDIMNHACRALAYMLEALPRSSATVVDAIPVFLEKLQVIQCMDVAEQSLTALEILSRRHSKAILQANGVSACLTYLDFFSMNAQRSALAITSHCCLNLQSDEFHFVSESMPMMARLLTQQDKKCVEYVCTAFYRLVESFQHEPAKLQEIATKELLKNCQQLLVVTPSVLNSGTFTNVIRMLSIMCASCPDLAITLLKIDIDATLLYLLTGSSDTMATRTRQVNGLPVEVELIERNPQELYEITCLIGELMPRLPNDGIFSVDALFERPVTAQQDLVSWQWRGDRGVWHSYSPMDSRVIEAAHQNSDDEISLITMGRTYTIDFNSMQQINEDTGTTRPVQRKINPTSAVALSSPTVDTSASAVDSGAVFGDNVHGTGVVNLALRPPNPYRDARLACLREERSLAAEFIKNLFSVLYEVYSSSAGPSVRFKCLRALLRMVYFASADLLREVLTNQMLSSHIAGMMASNDLRIVVGAMQMSEILMQKLPEIFGVHFRRDGVMHQINLLADPKVPICEKPKGTPKDAGFSPVTLGASDYDAGSTSSPSTSAGASASGLLSVGVTALQQAASQNPAVTIINLNQSTPTSSLAVNEMLNVGGDTIAHSSASPTVSGAAAMADHQQMLRSSSSGHSKMSDILKRKNAPKRKSQATTRSKSRNQDHHGEQSPAATSSVVQDLINKATALGSSGRSTPSASALSTPPNVAMAGSSGSASSGSSYSRSRFGSNSRTTSFLASLNPARWGRTSSSHSHSFSKDSHGSSASSSGTPGSSSLTSEHSSNSSLIAAGNREKARQWIREHAIAFNTKFGDPEHANNEPTVLARLSFVIQKLNGNLDTCVEALEELKQILLVSDISPFEFNHSGLIKAILKYMTANQGPVHRDDRLRAFLNVFAGLPLSSNGLGNQVLAVATVSSNAYSSFVAKLNGCATQLEQFPVKVHDFFGRSNTSALKFFNTHQLKCNLQRHPDCTNLRQWKGGTVKIDPLALVQAIERYLVVRGYGGIRVDSEEDSEEDIDDSVAAVVMSQSSFKHKLQFMIGENVLPYDMTVYQAVRQFSPLVNDQSETDTDTEMPIGNASVWVQQHTIFYRPIDDEPQASSQAGGSSNSNAVAGRASSSTSSSSSSRKHSDKGSSKTLRKKAEFWTEGAMPSIVSPITPFLQDTLPKDIVTVQDASLDALCMLRIVYALNRHWETLYHGAFAHDDIVPTTEFIHSKITAKANRQLQDPLVIMTGNLPQWLQQIATACPFLFPFETRHLLFYAITFDRDRALQRLLETTPDLNSTDTTEKVTPRLDKRKRTISREEILKQAEHIIQDFGHSKALLEIQYENEVGTGLGPTLEFYALVSGEMQRADLGLWNEGDTYRSNSASSSIADCVKSGLSQIDDDSQSPASHFSNLASNMVIEQSTGGNGQQADGNDNIEQRVASSERQYVFSPFGLFPMPIGNSMKISQISHIKTKFKFLGKFMAKAIMDSRMLDLPFSIPFYRWLLAEETSLGLADLSTVAPEVQSTLKRLLNIVRERDDILSDQLIDEECKNRKIEYLNYDSCPIADLGLYFTLPGHASIELRRGGRDISVTIHNLHQYISLVTHWFLVKGAQVQFEAIREGFDSVFQSQRLKLFYPEEVEKVLCGSGINNFHRWDIKMLHECCRTDHGFTQESKAIQFLFEIMSSFNREEQRLFLQFVTGSPCLPTGGFKAYNPPLTIVRKTLDLNENPDDYLPSVMTCVNYLKLPDYSSRDSMRSKLKMACVEGSMSFHLS